MSVAAHAFLAFCIGGLLKAFRMHFWTPVCFLLTNVLLLSMFRLLMGLLDLSLLHVFSASFLLTFVLWCTQCLPFPSQSPNRANTVERSASRSGRRQAKRDDSIRNSQQRSAKGDSTQKSQQRRESGVWMPKWTNQHETVLNEAVWPMWETINSAFADDETQLCPESVKWYVEVPRKFYSAYQQAYGTDANIAPKKIYEKFSELKSSRKRLEFETHSTTKGAEQEPSKEANFVYIAVVYKHLTVEEASLPTWEKQAISALKVVCGSDDIRVKCTCGSLTFHLILRELTLERASRFVTNVTEVLTEIAQDAADEFVMVAGSAASIAENVATRSANVVREMLSEDE